MLLRGTRIALLAVIGLLSSTLSLGAPLPQADRLPELPQTQDPTGLAAGIGDEPYGKLFGVQLDQIFGDFGSTGFLSYSVIFKVKSPAQITDDHLMRIARMVYLEMIEVHTKWTSRTPAISADHLPKVMAIMELSDNIIYAASSVKFPNPPEGAIERYRDLQADFPNSISQCLSTLAMGDLMDHNYQGLCGEVNLIRLHGDMQLAYKQPAYTQPQENTRAVAFHRVHGTTKGFCTAWGPDNFGCSDINTHYSRNLGRGKTQFRVITGPTPNTGIHELEVEQMWNVRHQYYDGGQNYNSDQIPAPSDDDNGSGGSGGSGGGRYWHNSNIPSDDNPPPPGNQEHAAQIQAGQCGGGSTHWYRNARWSKNPELRKYAKARYDEGWTEEQLLEYYPEQENPGVGGSSEAEDNDQPGYTYDGSGGYYQPGDHGQSGHQRGPTQAEVEAQIARMQNLNIGRQRRSEDLSSQPGAGKVTKTQASNKPGNPTTNKPEANNKSTSNKPNAKSKPNEAAKSKSGKNLKTGKTQDPRASQPGKDNGGQAKACPRPTSPPPPPPAYPQRILSGKGKGKGKGKQSKDTRGSSAPAGGSGKGKAQAPVAGKGDKAPPTGKKNNTPAAGKDNKAPTAGKKNNTPPAGKKNSAPVAGKDNKASAAGKDNKAPTEGKGKKGPAGQPPNDGADKQGAGLGKKTTKAPSGSPGGKATKAARAAA